MNRRIVLDTGILVSAALRAGSIPHRVLVAALGSWDLCASAETLAELERVLMHRKFDRYLNRTMRKEFIALIQRNVHLFAVREEGTASVTPPCRDPKDDQFLALAIAAQADIIVSSDDDLLVLNPWRGIPILSASQFLSLTE